ncbi:biotin synthase BioB [Thermosulfurimonas marina]|uniref:Biotin synthase n=1 Tax=Thermosulfurimonas marina TaxID=2047767 RepID=A0A6H1WQL5_9BACT|nr:biotin synthase BioB [Thermosulfurimonas marina]QJA05450.1 biotin synthase BioB [Thermosulfurimonas marina]
MEKETLRGILSGKVPLWPYLEEARRLREEVFGSRVETCAIVNAKSGRCPSDCRFCAQSAHWQTEAPVYPLLSEDRLLRAVEEAARAGVDRFSFVTSGVRLSGRELERLLRVIARCRREFPGLKLCASLGTLGREELQALKEAGLSRYHHNLETAESFYPRICTTQRWRDRYETALRVKEVGLSLCCGGIFGLGEGPEEVLEFAETLAELSPDSVPVNFLHPIPGTPLAGANFLTPLKCLAILVVLRLSLPRTQIRVCGGREFNLRELQALVPLVCDALMVGNYLTTRGRRLSDDRRLIEDLGYTCGLKV